MFDTSTVTYYFAQHFLFGYTQKWSTESFDYARRNSITLCSTLDTVLISVSRLLSLESRDPYWRRAPDAGSPLA